jgi:hypothetical protein
MRRLTFTFPPGVFEGQDDAKKEEGSDEELQTYDKEEVQKTKMLLNITFYDESIEYNSSGETRIGAAQQLSMVGEKIDYEEAEFQQKGEQERVEASEMASIIGIADSVEPGSTTDQDRGTQELVQEQNQRDINTVTPINVTEPLQSTSQGCGSRELVQEENQQHRSMPTPDDGEPESSPVAESGQEEYERDKMVVTHEDAEPTPPPVAKTP